MFLTSVCICGVPKVTSIGHSVLRDCASLTSIDLQGLKAVTSIGNYFLFGCTSLTTKVYTSKTANMQRAAFGAECFWGTEKFFRKEFGDGLTKASVGYMRGTKQTVLRGRPHRHDRACSERRPRSRLSERSLLYGTFVVVIPAR